MGGSVQLGTSLLELASDARDRARLIVDAIPLGDRTWRVFVERWRWPGGQRGPGNGTPALVGAANELTPRPLVNDKRGRQLYAGGLSDAKVVVLELGLSDGTGMAYTEADLAGGTILDSDGWYYRLADATSSSAQASVYFQLSTEAPPKKDLDDTLGWIISLTPVEAPR